MEKAKQSEQTLLKILKTFIEAPAAQRAEAAAKRSAEALAAVAAE